MHLHTGNHWYDSALDFSSDSRRLAVTDVDSTLVEYDVFAAQVTQRLDHGNTKSACIRYDPTGNYVALARGSTARVIDIRDGSRVSSFSYRSAVQCVAWSPDGKRLVAGCSNGDIHVANVALAKEICVCHGHEANVRQIAFSQNGNFLVSWSWDGTTRLWDSRTGDSILQTESGGAQFSNDDSMIAFGRVGESVGRWKWIPSTSFQALVDGKSDTRIESLFFSPSGNLLFTKTPEEIVVWDLANALPITRLSQFSSALWLDNGQRLLTGGFSGISSWPISRSEREPTVVQVGPPVKLFDPKSTQRKHSFTDRSISGKHQTLGVSVGPGQFVLLDPNNGKIRRRIQAAGHAGISVSAEGEWAATVPWNGVTHVAVWDSDSGDLVKKLPTGISASATFSPNGRWLVTSDSLEFVFWSLPAFERKHVIAGNHGPLSFSADGQMVAIGQGRTIELYDAHSLKILAKLDAPQNQLILCVAFDSAGARLAAGTASGTVQVWNLNSIRHELAALTLDWNLPDLPETNASIPEDRLIQIQFEFGNDWQAWYEHGLSFARRELWKQAIDSWVRCTELAGQPESDSDRKNLASAQNSLAWLYSTCPLEIHRNVEQALELAMNSVQLNADSAAAWNTLGVARYRNRQWDLAIEAFEKSIELNGGDAFDWYFMAMTHLRKGDLIRARQLFKQAETWMNESAPHDEELIAIKAEAERLFLFGQ